MLSVLVVILSAAKNLWRGIRRFFATLRMTEGSLRMTRSSLRMTESWTYERILAHCFDIYCPLLTQRGVLPWGVCHDQFEVSLAAARGYYPRRRGGHAGTLCGRRLGLRTLR